MIGQVSSWTKINADHFRSFGLYCMILTYGPKGSEMTISVNFTRTIQMEASVGDAAIIAKMKHRFEESSGITYDHFPKTASLIYTRLDVLPNQEKTKMKRRKAFGADYMDRRGRIN